MRVHPAFRDQQQELGHRPDSLRTGIRDISLSTSHHSYVEWADKWEKEMTKQCADSYFFGFEGGGRLIDKIKSII